MKTRLLVSAIILFSYGHAFPADSFECNHFIEVNPSSKIDGFKSYVTSALEELSKSKTQVARWTLWSICQGKVKLDEISDLTRDDYRQIVLDNEQYKWGYEWPLNQYQKLADKNSTLVASIRENLSGYTWNENIYLSFGQTPQDLAATLVHEVNHVLNQSNIPYYMNDYYALIEEFRGFYVEELFKSNEKPSKIDRLKIIKHVIESYGFKGINLKSIPEIPPGLMIPDTQSWETRDNILKRFK